MLCYFERNGGGNATLAVVDNPDYFGKLCELCAEESSCIELLICNHKEISWVSPE